MITLLPWLLALVAGVLPGLHRDPVPPHAEGGGTSPATEGLRMLSLLARNRVCDYATWRRAFDAEADAAAAAGLRLAALWRDADDPDDVYFLFEVADRERAEAYMADPRSAAVGEAAGVIDGEVHFLVSPGDA